MLFPLLLETSDITNINFTLTPEQQKMIQVQRPHPSPRHYCSIRQHDSIPTCVTTLTQATDKNHNLYISHHLVTHDHPKEYTLLILIESSQKRTLWRTAIRQTWKHTLPKDIILLFVIPGASNNPTQVVLESKMNEDMIFFHKIHPKSPSSGRLMHYLYWLNKLYNFTYLLRTYDNYYIKVKDLMEILASFKSTKHLYLGYFRGNTTVTTATDTTWFLCPSYTPHAEGGAYVLSSSLIHRFLKHSQFLNYYNNEGGSIGLWLSPFKDVTFQHDFNFNSGLQGHTRGCRNTYVTSPMESEQEIRDRHLLLTSSNGRQFCQTEYETERSYFYDWSQLPSQCCQQLVPLFKQT